MEFIFARVAHVIGVVLWIGGVAMVTMVLLPTVMRFKAADERMAFFQLVEQRFAWQAMARRRLPPRHRLPRPRPSPPRRQLLS